MKGTRPTSDRVREAIFSRLEHLGAVEDARVLDLYAGSGALGLEALSRGARTATLVDAARGAVEACRRNARALGFADVRVAQLPAERFTRDAPTVPWDLVLIDPPYDVTEPDLALVLRQLAADGVLADDSTVVVERSSRGPEPTLPDGWVLDERKQYGETSVYYVSPGGTAA